MSCGGLEAWAEAVWGAGELFVWLGPGGGGGKDRSSVRSPSTESRVGSRL